MSDTITTFTGVRFNPTDPKPEYFVIEDIAHSLPLICRGNGQVKEFFSVAQHCINCAEEAAARNYPARVQMACLLHDAGECYLSDVPRPFKKFIPEYYEYEDRILRVIYTKFMGRNITEEENRLVREVDDVMLYYDLHTLLKMEEQPEPELHIPLDYEFVPFQEVEKRYLELFEKLRSRL